MKYIRSIIFITHNSESPSVYMTLSRRLAVFPRLEQLGYLFGWYELSAGKQPDASGHFWHDGGDLTQANKDRVPAWSHFVDVLALIGVPTDRLELNIMVVPGGQSLKMYETDIIKDVESVLRVAAEMKARNRIKQTE